jgi:hypothetical protein
MFSCWLRNHDFVERLCVFDILFCHIMHMLIICYYGEVAYSDKRSKSKRGSSSHIARRLSTLSYWHLKFSVPLH